MLYDKHPDRIALHHFYKHLLWHWLSLLISKSEHRVAEFLEHFIDALGVDLSFYAALQNHSRISSLPLVLLKTAGTLLASRLLRSRNPGTAV